MLFDQQFVLPKYTNWQLDFVLQLFDDFDSNNFLDQIFLS